ncbi:MAG: hypothetical protein AAGE89_17485 [Pseudomonadota bacterium]
MTVLQHACPHFLSLPAYLIVAAKPARQHATPPGRRYKRIDNASAIVKTMHGRHFASKACSHDVLTAVIRGIFVIDHFVLVIARMT